MSLAARLTKLEGTIRPRWAVGIQEGEHGLVHVSTTGERITAAEFARRYPEGHIRCYITEESSRSPEPGSLSWHLRGGDDAPQEMLGEGGGARAG